jgi:hypothetical protein
MNYRILKSTVEGVTIASQVFISDLALPKALSEYGFANTIYQSSGSKIFEVDQFVSPSHSDCSSNNYAVPTTYSVSSNNLT